MLVMSVKSEGDVIIIIIIIIIIMVVVKTAVKIQIVIIGTRLIGTRPLRRGGRVRLGRDGLGARVDRGRREGL